MWLLLLPAKQCVAVNALWKVKDVISFVIYIPALPIGKR